MSDLTRKIANKVSTCALVAIGFGVASSVIGVVLGLTKSLPDSGISESAVAALFITGGVLLVGGFLAIVIASMLSEPLPTDASK